MGEFVTGLAAREITAPDRIFGEHEADAMFEALHNALALLQSKHCGAFLSELQNERQILLAHRKALANLLAATKSENFSRVTKREMTQWLRAAIKQAEGALNG